MNTLAVHLYHDSTVAMNCEGVLRNIELERVFSKRYYDWTHEDNNLDNLLELILKEGHRFDIGLYVGDEDDRPLELFQRLGIPHIHRVDHHLAHAAAALYQSPFKKSLIISFDGGGNDGTFKAFIGCRKQGIKALFSPITPNLGIPYRALAYPISEIHKPDDGKERSNAGKLMGLAAYGKVRPEWIEPLSEYFQKCSVNGAPPSHMYRWVVSQLQSIGAQLGLSLARNALLGAESFDFARTGQHVFESLFLDLALPLARDYKLPICLSGGCALNVLLNQRLSELVDLPIFIPPNPNDCGLALGALLFEWAPSEPVSVTYTGVPILDLPALPEIVAKYGGVEAGSLEIAHLLSKGAVVAVMRGNSEHGPRALGNRSILCDPGVVGMKERLNQRVKFREDFRPYAPVVRVEEVGRYFENARNDLSYMSFNPTVKPEWRNALQSALHVDFTARVQTVSHVQNPWLYDLLVEFERLSGSGALLNTSFNCKGRPMVARAATAIEEFLATDIDCLVIENWLFKKPARTAAGSSPRDE